MGVLWWNEGRSVHTAQSLAEGKGAVVSVSADAAKSENNGKLVHMSGQATTDESLSDSEFEVEVTGDLKLQRTVEMYQWKENSKSETRKKIGGGEETVTTYTYEKTWSDDRLDSGDYHDQGHDNPAFPSFQSQEFVAQKAHVGVFQLGGLTAQINSFQSLKEDKANTQMDGHKVFFGDVPSPQIGDVRVKWEVVKPCEISLLARQSNDQLEPYRAKAGDEIYRVMMGKQSAEQMFGTMESENNMFTWIARFLGWLFMFIGFCMVLKPFSVLADIIPFFGNLVEMGTGIIAFAASAGISLVVIAVAWIAYRPVIGLGLLVLGGAIVFMVLKKKKS